MLRTPLLLSLVTLSLAGPFAHAQTPPKPSEAPPKLEVVEEGPDAPVTVTPRHSGGAKITEKKEGGRVTEVKVKSGKSSYTMKPNIPAGNAQPGDAQSSTLRAPQWTVLEFDLNKKKNAGKDAAPDATPAVAPPPPPMQPTK